ncbi:PREDICTED: ankyrin repeat domain-containing protein 7-like isoform X2 [Polistes dominula]|uniref:Ankyrin repeat domain-containing protein 7-like isoform X2 n=1 Tax=Polistes dominula TaxID=743375 RepID=A0ABM1HZA1_POLDO|nr:PREDICTED: ankyrin repeat domain-containing protein 7-like isoform X2 [Polistes dominula]
MSIISNNSILSFYDGQSYCFVKDILVPGYTIEEELIRIIGFASFKEINDFISKISSHSINLHYPTFDLKTPLLEVVRREDVQILALLLDKIPVSLDDTTTQPCGKTVLMSAAYTSRNTEILQLLLKKGANPNKLDVRNWSCLQYAIVGERIKNVEILLDIGLDINARDCDDRTPLMIADRTGFTALQLAILRKKRDAAIILIEKGSNVYLPTPLTKISLKQLSEITLTKLLPSIQYDDDDDDDVFHYDDQDSIHKMAVNDTNDYCNYRYGTTIEIKVDSDVSISEA